VDASIELTAGREAKGYRRFSPERQPELERAVEANLAATQEQLAREIGVSRSTIGRIERSRARAAALSQGS
jgi:DNA-binding XRE family transcriptional regulator